MCECIKTFFLCIFNFLRTIPYVSILATAMAFSGWVMTITFWDYFMAGVQAFGFDFTEFEVYALFFVNFYMGMCAFNVIISVFTTGWIAEKCCHKEEGCWSNFVQLCIGEWLQLAFVVLAIAGSAICFVMVMVGCILWSLALVNSKFCGPDGGIAAGIRPQVIALWNGVFGGITWPIEFLNDKKTGFACSNLAFDTEEACLAADPPGTWSAEIPKPCLYNSETKYKPYPLDEFNALSGMQDKGVVGDDGAIGFLTQENFDAMESVPDFSYVLQIIVAGFACMMFSQVVMWVHAACCFIDVWDSRESSLEGESKPLSSQEVKATTMA